MTDEKTDNEPEGTDQTVVIEDLEVADADATQVKGGPVFLKIK